MKLHYCIGIADAVIRFPASELNKWEVNVMQDVKGKAFPALALVRGNDKCL